jgi:hypothetical protein
LLRGHEMSDTGSHRLTRRRSNSRVVVETTPGCQEFAENRPAGDGRITVTLADGTVLMLIGAPRLLIPVASSTGNEAPEQA